MPARFAGAGTVFLIGFRPKESLNGGLKFSRLFGMKPMPSIQFDLLEFREMLP